MDDQKEGASAVATPEENKSPPHYTFNMVDWVAAQFGGAPSTLVIFLALLRRCEATGGDEPTGPKCPIFEGINIAFVSWLIAFSAWIAWKKPELAPFIRGTSPMPVPADPNRPTPKEKSAIKKWTQFNTQLYGAIVSHVAPPIQASLHVATPDDGVKAINHLKHRYGAQSTGDRAEAMARVQKSYIDPRAKISEADVIKQYNEMSMAVADVRASGGAALDDSLLISMFENSLPTSYSSIRQMVRYSKHTLFDAYFNDLLTQVKAEERSAQSTLSTAFTAYLYGKGRGKGKGERGRSVSPYAKGKGRGYGRGGNVYNACFNCGKGDHPRYNCPCPPAVCEYCGANHISEFCSLGPGGPLRDSLSVNARLAIDRAAGKGRQSNRVLALTSNRITDYPPQLAADYQSLVARTYNACGKRPHSEITPSDSASCVGSGAVEHGGPSSSTAPAAQTSSGERLYVASSNHQRVPSAREINDFLQTSGYGVFVAQVTPGNVCMQVFNRLHSLVYIDSQASHFVVPDPSYLTKVTNSSPNISVETANGCTTPEAIGELVLSLFDDDGVWHTFTVSDAWVISSCKRILYSQSTMNRLGVTHRLDEGYMTFRDGAKKSVSSDYSIEVMWGRPDIPSANLSQLNSDCFQLVPTIQAVGSTLSQSYSDSIKPTPAVRAIKSTIPQRLLWQRLGYPSQRIWLNVCDVTNDHGLPPNPHLKYDFGTNDAITRARSRLLPFHRIREPDPSHSPGATVYMDFAGPMVASYPHKFVYYCGAIDAGSGYARLLPCHTATKEMAKSCLELLTADLRMLMGLPQGFKPQVVVTDQGTQFMSHYFVDFLAEQQIVHRPAVTYTPQQNAFVERMWGTRFGIARTLLKAANLGPAFHPFAVQTSNWICNRMPQPWKGNLSPFYMLTRRPASIGYLRVFGSLARVTIPWAKREGDKHFADRGMLGLYLGPSEVSPGCVVYVPSTRRFYTSRDVICYEDTQPGVKHVESTWKGIQESHDGNLLTGTSGELPAPESQLRLTYDAEAAPQNPPAATPTATVSESPAFDPHPPAAEVEHDDPADHFEHNPTDVVSGHPTVDHEVGQNVSTELETTDQSRKRRLPAGDSGDASDPSSRMFVRRLPPRASRYGGAYYVDPTKATVDQHLQNAIYQALHSHGIPVVGEVILYESVVCADGYALSITNTTEMGDIVIPRSYRQALESAEASYWREAVAKELKGLIEIGTFEFVRAYDVPSDANIMRCHFVFTVKRHSDGSIEKFKARLVADGNTQRWGVDFDRVFSTVAKLSTLRLVLALAAAYNLNLSSIDIRQAYLQATLSDELYMMVPPGLPSVDENGFQLVARLKRSLYGLKQAGREWHQLFADTLKRFGFTQSCIDTCLFTYSRGSSTLWIVVWVDDCIIADNDPSLRSEFVKYVSSIHPTEDKGDLTWVLQVRIIRDRPNKTLTLSQEMYINDLVKRHGQLTVGLSRRFDSPFDASLELSNDQCPKPGSPECMEMEPYREAYMSLVGAYLWLSNVSRPDICYISSQLARFVSNPGYAHYRAALRVLIYLQGSVSRGLTYRPNVNFPLRGFVDANWATKFSVSGGLIDFMGAPIHWFSRSQRSVSMSSTESEFFATNLMVKEIVFFRELLADLGFTQTGPTVVRTDNRGVVDLSFDPVAFKKTKHILRAAEFVRDLSSRRVISLVWISGSSNPADLFTKSFTCVDFRRLCGLLSHMTDIR